jgi:hypothetical protein
MFMFDANSATRYETNVKNEVFRHFLRPPPFFATCNLFSKGFVSSSLCGCVDFTFISLALQSAVWIKCTKRCPQLHLFHLKYNS